MGDPDRTVEIYEPAAEEADALADMWVELAAGQRDYGSHLLAEGNRTRIRDSMARHAVTGGLLVARAEDLDGGSHTDSSGDVGTHQGGADGPIGFVMFSVESGDYRKDRTRGVVQNIYVREGHRRDGVGSALLARAEAALREQGADVVGLEVMADNEAAREFYRGRGYAPHRVELEKDLDSESDTHTRDGR